MGSREAILLAVKNNQPAQQPLPDFTSSSTQSDNLKEKFVQTLTAIGGKVVEAEWKDIADLIKQEFLVPSRIVNTVAELNSEFEILNPGSDSHHLHTVTLAILKGEFGVAENGAIWLTDKQMGNPALPYICEHLVLIINNDSILATLHEAYEKIGTTDYRLGTFIAGPSKTADIEQSLVLGAHGSKSLTVFLTQ